MRPRRPLFVLWTVLGALLATLLLATAKPMAVGWRCYRLHAAGEHARAEVAKKLERSVLVLMVASGSQAGHACTATTSPAHHEVVEIGDTLAVVTRPGRPGECVLEGTLRNSASLLWFLTAGIAFAATLLLAIGVFVHRSLTARVFPTSQLRADAKDVKCPECGAEMAEGYLPLLSGLHWRRPAEPVGLPHALSGLPGTVGWQRRPRLHAFRCEGCSVITLKYGATTGPR